MPSTSHKLYLTEQLKDCDFACEYLNAAMKDNDKAGLFEAVKNVIDAHGGISKLASLTGRQRTSLFRSFGKAGNPLMKTFIDAIEMCGLELRVVPKGEKLKVA